MNTWIMPCNLKYFDINKRFEEFDYVVWKRGARVEKGDVIYIYVGQPLSRIQYKCTVEDPDVANDVLEENSYAKIGDIEHNRKYMKLKLEYAYQEGVPLSKLQDLGLFGVRKQTRLDRRILDYMNKINLELGITK